MKSILKRVLICVCVVVMVALCFLLPFLSALTGNDLTANADSVYDDFDNPNFYTFQSEIYVSSDLSNILYRKFFFPQESVNSNGRYFNVSYYNMPRGSYTCHIVNNVSYPSTYRISFVIIQYLSDGLSVNYLTFSDNVGYVSFDISNVSSFQLQVMSQNSNPPYGIDLDFDTYFYEGDYNSGYVSAFFNGSVYFSSVLGPVYYDRGYKVGYAEGYNLKVTESINPLSFFLKPAQDFINLPIFGKFSMGDALSIFMFVALGTIFIKMFAGG